MEEPRIPTPRSRGMKVTIAVGVATGLAIGATALAGAVTAPDPAAPADPPAASTAQAPTPPPPPPDGVAVRAGRPGPGGPGGPGRHRDGPGMGMGMGIHGEFVVPAPGGGYQTMASQMGEVTDVSATSIKVKSEDGFEKTYAVNDDSIVHAGDNGIGDVKVGDKVHVLAIVTGDTAKAVEVRDHTANGERREKWAPRPQRKQDKASPPTTVS